MQMQPQQPRRRRPFLPLVVSSLVLVCLCFPFRIARGQVCTAAPPVTEPIRVAILVHCNAPLGVLDDNPNFSSMCAADHTPTGGQTTRAFNFGLDFYVRSFRALLPPEGMPLRDGRTAQFNFTYINIGYVDWNAPDWSAVDRGLFGPAAATTAEASSSGGAAVPITSGFAWDLLMTPKYGGPYPFGVTPFSTGLATLATLADICEEQGTCILSSGFTASAPMFMCRESLDGDGLRQPDCIRRGRLTGTRRFDHFLSVLFDASAVSAIGLECFHTMGAQTLYIVAEAPIASFLPLDGLLSALEFAKQLNIQVLGVTRLVACSANATVGSALACPRFQKNGLPALDQFQILPDGMDEFEFGRRMAQLAPDALIVLATTNGGSAYTVGSLFDGFRAADWTPKIMNFLGGADAILAPHLTRPDDIAYWLSNAPWDYRLTGPAYRNIRTPSNFELFPAEPDSDGPQVFAREFSKRYDQYYPATSELGSVGGYNFRMAGATLPVCAFQSLVFIQKLVETALSASVPALITASLKVSLPSLYHQLQFDGYGRTVRVNEILLQYTPTTTAAGSDEAAGVSATSSATGLTVTFPQQIIAPYNIGRSPIFPAPTWAERVFAPERYRLPLERMMAALTCVCILVVVTFICLLVAHSDHAVIRAATPSFCLLTCLGALLMLTANFFHTTVEHASDCAAQVWLLTFGFTLMFTPLFVKTFRLFHIFVSTRLQTRRLEDVSLLFPVGAFLSLDLVLNLVWHGAYGMASEVVQVDPHRPSKNIRRCAYSHGVLPFVYAHLASKCAVLLCGILLAWKVRAIPSLFREASAIGVCIYNVSLVVGFAVPLLAKDVGGRETTYLIRAFAVMFVCVSTVCILYIPKLLAIRQARRAALKGKGRGAHQLAVGPGGAGGGGGGGGGGPHNGGHANRPLFTHADADATPEREQSPGDGPGGLRTRSSLKQQPQQQQAPQKVLLPPIPVQPPAMMAPKTPPHPQLQALQQPPLPQQQVQVHARVPPGPSPGPYASTYDRDAQTFQYPYSPRGYTLAGAMGGIVLTQDSGEFPPAPIVQLRTRTDDETIYEIEMQQPGIAMGQPHYHQQQQQQQSSPTTDSTSTTSPSPSPSPARLDDLHLHLPAMSHFGLEPSELAHTELSMSPSSDADPQLQRYRLPHMSPMTSPPGRIDSGLHLSVVPVATSTPTTHHDAIGAIRPQLL